jgi:hypothetical protein
MPKLTLKQTKKITISKDGQVLATTNKKTMYGSVTTIHRISKPTKKMIKMIEQSNFDGDDNIFNMLGNITDTKKIASGGASSTRKYIKAPIQAPVKAIENVIDLTML